VDAAVSFASVSRSFGAVRAVDGLDLSVPPGSVTVLLGANGAGKTTTLRLTTGVLAPDAGSIRVLGHDPAADGQALRRRCGVVPPKPAMYDRLTGRQNLKHAAVLYDLDRPPIDDLAERFGIRGALDQRVAGYSTGMRTRLALTRALLHDPELLLLDEPTAGLDPEAAREVRHLILEMAGGGKTVIMSTHLLHEAEGAVDQVVMMEAGRAWDAGDPHALAARYWSGVRVHLDAEEPAVLQAAADRIGLPMVVVDGLPTVTVDRLADLPDLVACLIAEGVRLTRVEPVAPTLERLYFEMRRRARENP
jgi:ABC-2 type transport system ATP-binding protein